MQPTTDTEIRAALHRKKLMAYRNAPETVVVDELGLSHAKVRVDIAVINGCIHGFEIKSALDTLNRLPSQLEFYTQCSASSLSSAHLGTWSESHRSSPIGAAYGSYKGSRGAVTFATLRRGRSNSGLDPVQLAHLLWHPEAAALLARYGASPKELRQSRKQLYTDLAAHMTVRELTAAIREFMLKRQAWRDRPAHA